LPLLLTQINTAFVWSCAACVAFGVEYHGVTDGLTLLEGSNLSYRNLTLRLFLDFAPMLEPLSIFMYTWCFLGPLERESGNNVVKFIYRWFSRVSIVFLPLAFYGIYTAYAIEFGRV